MKLQLDENFRAIARAILAQGKELEEWVEIESDDMFQKGLFVGGFDATEGEFCFSFEGSDGEFWFQLSLNDISKAASGELAEVEARPAQ